MTRDKESSFFKRPMTRRQALKVMGAASAAGLMGAGMPDLLKAQPSGKRPNIIFILSDDHRWDHLSILGHPFIETPNLDRLAAEGILFENAFVTTSLCSPSRASFITGTYAHTHGVKNNITPWSNDNITFMELLKKVGYDTAFIGKWHMPGDLPDLRGVDEFTTFTVQGGQGKYFNCPLIVNGVEEPSKKPYITEELTDRAIEYLKKGRENPFCLMLAHKAVHHQFLPPPELADHYHDVEVNYPDEMNPLVLFKAQNHLFGVFGSVDMHYKNYCETIYALDQQIGRVLDTLDEMGVADDTVVVYAGDNGYFWGEHNQIDKRWAYEESMRIPFIVRYPRGMTDVGRNVSSMVLNVDLAPTILDLAGIDVPSYMEGKSFRPYFTNPYSLGREAWLYEYYKDYPYRYPPHYAVRTDTHKYIVYDGRKKSEIFDLVGDPKEMNNLYGTPEGESLLPFLEARLNGFLKQYDLV
ncbi:MAG: sulfatase [Deltaproteobacteria bacterium]|nr:sulfatase [Candidatus Zymogenaceae bacterium]